MTIEEFRNKYGTDGPKLIINNLLARVDIDQQDLINVVNELMEDLQSALMHDAKGEGK